MRVFVALVLVSSTVVFYGCGKDVELRERPVGGGRVLDPEGGACVEDDVVRWRFVQPPPTEIRRKVDLLFVVDTSRSLRAERERIATTVPEFVTSLHPDTDIRIAVMLAHGGASFESGRLYAAPGSPRVLDSKKHSGEEIRRFLRNTLERSDLPDADEANGEMMIYSFGRSLEAEQMRNIQKQGFYRPDAVWSVVFVSDENDTCFRPEMHGYHEFPHYVRSALGYEVLAYNKYCKDPAVSPETAWSRLLSRRDRSSVALGAITHVSEAKVPRVSEDAIGHGLIELIDLTQNGVKLDISDDSYSEGLTRLADMVSKQQELQTLFRLEGAGTIVRNSIAVSVDGVRTEFGYTDDERTVEIAVAHAGGPGSVVEVAACVRNSLN